MSNKYINTKLHRIRFGHLSTTEANMRLHPDDSNQIRADTDDRQLFYRLIHPDNSDSALHAARIHLNKQLSTLGNRAGYTNLLSGQIDTLEDELRVMQKAIHFESPIQANTLPGAIRQFAPMALLELCWLQSVNNAALAHTESAATLFQIYMSSLGYRPNSKKRVSLYRKVLDDFNIFLPETHTHVFAFHPGFVDAAFIAPVTGLSLAQLPVSFLPEILGYTLAYAFDLSQTLHLIETMASSAVQSEIIVPESLNYYLHSTHNIDTGELAIQATRDFIERQRPEQQSEIWQRISHGIMLYADVERDLADALQQQTVAIQRVWRDGLESEQQVSVQSSVSGEIELCGNQLDVWFEKEPLVAMKFLKEIVNADHPEYQTAEMRRFFSDSSVFGEHGLQPSEKHQLKLLAKRLAEMDSETHQTGLDSQSAQSEQGSDQNKTRIVKHGSVPKYTSRQLYYQLLNQESYPECLVAGYHFVCRYLYKSRSVMRSIRPAHQRLIKFSHLSFIQQIKTIYQVEAAQQKAFTPPPKLSKEAYLWGIEQFSPVLLVDGSWLQNVAKTGNHQHSISRYLMRIYADEIGDGRSDWNHANVYRQLLESTNIQLPEFTSEQFSQHQGFVDSAFDLPVFFLAISQFPSSFEAEIIGLNMAIELSGLGATYSRLMDELNYWEIDSRIVSLHLSIDNLATGHAALAQDAVVIYLDQVLNTSGYAEMQKHWQRIWSGYLALQVVPAKFRRALIWNYFKRFRVMSTLRKLV